MSSEPKFIPASSQTVGPFFRIGLESLMNCAPAIDSAAVTIHGRVLDRDGAPVSDAMLEFWSSACDGTLSSDAYPQGFRRVGTDLDGAFTVTSSRPKPIAMEDGSVQAPHLLVLVFARGLLRHVITRVNFDGETANAADPVLLSVPAARRNTLIARREGTDLFRWDVILQGNDETVFFAW
ncbi:MAG TPA: protocatechuate 3,4-dioxygenase subunit alpha [Terracidiphilus sp.]|nr:protocatechuate 3,4-dioxygenase subunit alpha [Terracidiphilus sp.]